MYATLILSGLIARPVRTAVSVMAVALEVILILTIIGLANGITTETGRRTEGVGADIASTGAPILGGKMPARA